MTSLRRVGHRSLPLASSRIEDPISISTAPGADLATMATEAASAEDTAPIFAVAARAARAI